METRKIDDDNIEVEKVVPATTEKVILNRAFLEKQKLDIQALKDSDNADRDRELAEVDAYLAECDKVGVLTKIVSAEEPLEESVVEPPVEELPAEEPVPLVEEPPAEEPVP